MVYTLFSPPPQCCRSITRQESCLKKQSLRDTPQGTLLEPISEHHPVWGFSTVFQGIDRLEQSGSHQGKRKPCKCSQQREFNTGSGWQSSGRARQPTRSFNMTHRWTTAGSPLHQQEGGSAWGHSGRWNRVVLPGRAGATEARSSWKCSLLGKGQEGIWGQSLGLTQGVSEERGYTVKVSLKTHRIRTS